MSGRKVAPAGILRQVMPYVWPEGHGWIKRRVVLAILLLLAAKLIAIGTPLLYRAAVDSLAGESEGPAVLLALGAIGATVAYGGARVLNTGFQQLRDVAFAPVGQRSLRMLALRTFRHIHQLSLRYHLGRKTGSLSRVMERGVKAVDFLLRFVLLSIGPLLLELLLTAGILAWLFDLRYLAVVLGTVVLYVAFTFAVTEWRVRIRREMNDQDQDASQKAVDSLLNFETVKYFGAEGREAARYDLALQGYQRAAVKTAYTLGFLNFGQVLIMTGGLVAVMSMAALGVQDGTLTVGDFVMVNAYMIQLIAPLGFLGSTYRDIRQALIDMDEMFTLLGDTPEVTDRPDAPALSVPRGEITFDAVHFAYQPEREILHGVSFTVAPGGTLALVGSTGSGKSTIGRLLFRFYDVTGGAIRIDGQDLREVGQGSLHDAIGVVPQDTVLFNDTIGYNIAYGRDGASRADVEAAAKAARVHDFIASLPDGYDTQVGERGLKLSGGEKQRVGIARTLLKNPPILLLDEATSALDTETEREIQSELRAMAQGRSAIVIAHRLSTVADADEIVVLEQGRVVERGHHEALLAREGRYAQLWQRQAAEEEAEAPDAD
nr:ABC transporter ATP-binding protein/permease [Pseudoroseicyclus aestuarii]